jgi:hypothetical protein
MSLSRQSWSWLWGRAAREAVSAIREAARRHARDVRELVIEVLDDQQLKQLGDASTVLLTALRKQDPPRE